MLKRLSVLLMTCAMVLSVLSTGVLAAQGSASRVVSAALSQVGYTETSDEYTKYGQWYGYPHGYWCDMFVSWCGSQAQISKEIFPFSASCTAHVSSFKKLGRYMLSAARGGSYVPQQGDLIFFYKPPCLPAAPSSPMRESYYTRKMAMYIPSRATRCPTGWTVTTMC